LSARLARIRFHFHVKPNKSRGNNRGAKKGASATPPDAALLRSLAGLDCIGLMEKLASRQRLLFVRALQFYFAGCVLGGLGVSNATPKSLLAHVTPREVIVCSCLQMLPTTSGQWIIRSCVRGVRFVTMCPLLLMIDEVISTRIDQFLFIVVIR
jgi:hypothetical protein